MEQNVKKVFNQSPIHPLRLSYDLQQTLDQFEVPASEQDELKTIVRSTREAIVIAPLHERHEAAA